MRRNIIMRNAPIYFVLSMLLMATLACYVGFEPPPDDGQDSGSGFEPAPPIENGETAYVTNVVDGDTIDVEMNGVGYRVRYVGVNTPERDEACYRDAVEANRRLVEGQTITMVPDESNTDRYGRLLRYIYVGGTFVNETMVTQGYAEAVEYRPDTRHTAYFRELERAAAAANVGCHPTGIFNDGTDTR